MNDGKRKTFKEKLTIFHKKLKKSEEKIDSAFGKFEKRLDELGKSAEESFERFGLNIDKKFGKLDKWFEETEKKLDLILETDGLKKHFMNRRTRGSATETEIKAVDGVDLDIARGETLGIVGESGCGKSTIARILIGLIPPSEGQVRLLGKDLKNCNKTELKSLRRRTGIVFQDPYGSLDPRMTVADIVGEPLRAHKLCVTKRDRLLQVLQILEACGLSADDMFKFPHQFSGGQRQRICIARAIVSRPDIVVCDEAVSALDVSIQAQIINLLCDLRDEFGLTYIFISHDLDVVRFIADRVAVMYLGRIVEIASKEALFENPCHPYTVALLKSAPVFGRRTDEMAEPASIEAESLEAEQQTGGCPYRPRCRMALPDCSASEPPLRTVAGGHSVACHRFGAEGKE